MRDVNNTRYHLLFGPDDWEKCTDGGDNLERKWEYITQNQRHVVQLQQEIFQFAATGASATQLSADDRRGATRDAFGHWYWIDPSQMQIMARWSKATEADVFYQQQTAPQPQRGGSFRTKAESDTPQTPEVLAGLAATSEGYLVVGLPESHHLLVLDLYSTDGVPVRLTLGEQMQPFDLAARADGGLLVLDSEHAEVWMLDRHLQVEPYQAAPDGDVLTFQPKEGDERRAQGESALVPLSLPTVTASSDCDVWDETINRAVAVEALPDGSFWVLDNPVDGTFSILWHIFPNSERPTECVPLQTINLVEVEDDDLDLAAIRAHDIAYLPDRAENGAWLDSGTVFVVDDGGNQAYALRYDGGNLRIQREYYPLRSFNGTAIHGVWEDGYAYYHQEDRWQPIRALPRRRYEESAVLLLPGEIAFDGKEPNCVWHRLCLDACIPPETGIIVEARAADTQDDLQWADWVTQPPLYKRPQGSEIPYTEMWGAAELNADTGTWELLLQRVHGRYMQFRLTLLGNIRATPVIRALRAHYPRFSYLAEYLPAVYQQDAVSAQFIENFLANPEGIYTLIEGMIAQIQVLMDVRTVPADAVDWLADWLGLAFDPGWDDYQRRLLIAQAPYFFTRRGTVPGMMQAILLAVYPELGPDIFRDDIANYCTTIRIVESFYRRMYTAAEIGDVSELPLAADATDATEETTAPDTSNTVYVNVPSANIRQAPTIADNVIRTAAFAEAFPRESVSADGQWVLLNLGNGLAGWVSAVSLADNDPRDDLDEAQTRDKAHTLAHRFTVLLPASIDSDTQRLVERVIELEKPAHTLCNIKQFWALFRVGAVRVGFDTILGEGGRIETFRLNQTALAEGKLSAAFPHSLSNRTVLGK